MDPPSQEALQGHKQAHLPCTPSKQFLSIWSHGCIHAAKRSICYPKKQVLLGEGGKDNDNRNKTPLRRANLATPPLGEGHPFNTPFWLPHRRWPKYPEKPHLLHTHNSQELHRSFPPEARTEYTALGSRGQPMSQQSCGLWIHGRRVQRREIKRNVFIFFNKWISFGKKDVRGPLRGCPKDRGWEEGVGPTPKGPHGWALSGPFLQG